MRITKWAMVIGLLLCATPAAAQDEPAAASTTFVAGAWCPVYSDAPDDDAPGCDMGVGVALAHRGPFAAVAAIGTKTVGVGAAWVVGHTPSERPVAVVIGAIAPYDERGVDVGGWGVAVGATFSIGNTDTTE